MVRGVESAPVFVDKNIYAKIIFAKILLRKEKIVPIHCSIDNYKNIYAKIIFAKILLNLEKKCDSIFLKGGNGEWKNYQH